MEERYRTDYEGEFVITGLKIVNGKKQQEREFVDNPIQVKSISGRATCVSTGISSTKIILPRLMEYHGILNTLPLNVYSVRDLYKKFHANFHVTFNTDDLQELIETNLTEEIIVYTSTTQCLKFPGEFFIIPYSYKSTEEAVAAYLAAFDGHKEIFLLGYDQYTITGERRTKIIESMVPILKAYPSTKFYHVISEGETPREWLPFRNLKTMPLMEYVSYCDIS
jgi:hypothetical protein